jgi:hypothetical protein
MLPVILLSLELHPQLNSFLLGQLVHGIKLAGNFLSTSELISQSNLRAAYNG